MFAGRKWLLGAIVGLIAAGSVAAGCGDDDGGGGDDKGGDQKAVNIAVLSWSYTDYNQAEEKGIKRVLAAYDGGGSVKWFNAKFDPQTLQKQCLDAISSGRYNAIVLSPVNPPTGVPCAKAANAAKIPVATLEQTVGTDPKRTYDLKPQVDGVVAVSTLTLDKQIEAQAELLKGACGDADPCKAIYETSSADDPFSKDIIARLEEEVPALEVVQQFTANFDPAAVAKAMPDLLAANRDLNVYISAADSSAVAALPAINDAGMADQVKVLGNGGSGTAAKAIAAGTIYGSNGNWPTQNGEQLTRALIQAVNGDEITDCCVDGLTIDTPLVLTKETIGDYKAEW